MKPNRLQEALAEGRAPVGHMISEFATRGIAKIVEAAGADFVILDMEHTGHGMNTIADLLAWFKAGPVAPLVRVPQPHYHFLARVMDAGALGVMVPNVESAEQAKGIVDAVKYAPLGNRGVGLGTAHTDYVMPDPTEYFEEANRRTTVICQIESVRGLENVEAIAAVEGVDIVWVGHYDLTMSMGIPGDFRAGRFVEAMKRVAAAAERCGKAAGIQPGNLEQAAEWFALGFRVLSWGTDAAVYRKALADGIETLRERCRR
ncbi:MAG TPA: hypothetical protein ENJ62_05795 [Bryobacterales bacterium]|nr:hypothetical protein [Bryobacterales bacterium]